MGLDIHVITNRYTKGLDKEIQEERRNYHLEGSIYKRKTV